MTGEELGPDTDEFAAWSADQITADSLAHVHREKKERAVVGATLQTTKSRYRKPISDGSWWLGAVLWIGVIFALGFIVGWIWE